MVSRQCVNCETYVGPGTGRKLLLCGRCKTPSYCSKECQVQHWPIHSPACGINADAKRQMASGIDIIDKALPGFNTRQSQKDYLSLPYELPNETIIAARSALRLGKPDSLAQTHLIHLRFTYNSQGETYRKRMHFEGGEVIAYADELERINQDERDNLLRARGQTEMGSLIPGSQKPAAAMQFVAVVQVRFPVDKTFMTHQLAVPLGIYETSLDFFVELKDSKLNPDWESFFRRVWEVPKTLGQYPLARLDFLASEKPEKGREVVKQFEKRTKSKLLAVGIKPLDL